MAKYEEHVYDPKFGTVPGDVPLELKRLTVAEEAMIKMVNEDRDWPDELRDLFSTCKHKFTPLPG